MKQITAPAIHVDSLDTSLGIAPRRPRKGTEWTEETEWTGVTEATEATEVVIETTNATI